MRRIYTEKIPGSCIVSRQLLSDLSETFNIKLEALRVVNRYDIEGIEDEGVFQEICRNILSEPMLDNLFLPKELCIGEGEKAFAMEYLPGQYNQRADSAIQCIKLITQNDTEVKVNTATLYILKGEFSDEIYEKIKGYIINTVDSRETSIDEMPLTLDEEITPAQGVETVHSFIEKSENELQELHREFGLAMSMSDLLFVQDYFKNTEKRNPTVTEIRVLDTYWSDHCRHTTFLTAIEKVEIEAGHFAEPIKQVYEQYLNTREQIHKEEKDICLMDVALMGMKALKRQGKLQDLDESEEINACSIVVPVDIDGVQEDWLVMFKNETHNHPTEIEPFGGAATCLGGAIRDPLSGRSYVYQAVRVTGCGNPHIPLKDTIKGKLPQKKITTEAAKGFSSYGNQIGLATGQVAEVYHDGFVAKRMEIGAVVGAAPRKNVYREAPAPGDYVILIGGRTGRDGCGGATGSSKEHNEQSIAKCGAEVQKGNPITERKIQRAFRNPELSRLIKRCNDFGAGGVSVAVGELADGLEINLDLVLKKYEGLDGTELAISESQERMAVVTTSTDAERLIELCLEENLEAYKIAEVVSEKRLQMFWRGDKIVDLSRAFLNSNGAKQFTTAKITAPDSKEVFLFDREDLTKGGTTDSIKEKWLKNLSNLNVCSQKGLVERFDSTIGTGTVLLPFGGETGLTPTEASISKIPVLRGETNAVTIMTYGYDPYLSQWSPFHGAVYAVVHALAKVAAAGGSYEKTRLSFQEYFERLGTAPEKWGKPLSGLLGAFYAQMETGIGAIGGKDSMSGTFNSLNVPPVVTAFALCPGNAENIISPEFKHDGSCVVYLPLPKNEYNLPCFTTLSKNYTKLHEQTCKGKILSAHTVGGYGVSEAISKMCFGNMIGVELDGDGIPLFSADYGSLVLEISKSEDVNSILEGLTYTIIGKTTGRSSIVLKKQEAEIPLEEAIGSWQKTLEDIFPSKASYLTINDDPILAKDTVKKQGSKVKYAKPRIFIPVFPGTNCEYDSRRAFEKAGGVVNELVFKNLSLDQIASSTEKIKELIDGSQILMLPGGFSAGDEPDGSAKFITAVFRNPIVKEAVHRLLKERDGLVLGICNGFQALIKLGLLTKGEISDTEATLTYNTVGRHISLMASTKVVSNRSPWMQGCSVGDVHKIPLSHGEGRFVASEEVINELFAKEQVATVYTAFNPNGSAHAIEGITSPCGRVFGKMGHSERIGKNLYKNILGNTDQKLFESGINYFS